MSDTETEYIPYGDEWVKEISKIPKNYIIENLLRPALIKQSELQSTNTKDVGLRWVKAIDRLPGRGQKVFWKRFNGKKTYTGFNDFDNVKNMELSEIEWLEESAQQAKPLDEGGIEKMAIKAVPTYPTYPELLKQIDWNTYIHHLRLEWARGYKAALNQK